MGWQAIYDAASGVLPTAASPAWSKTASSAPTTEAVSGGLLHMAQGASKNFYYTLAESSPTTYATHEIVARLRRVSGGAGRNDVCLLIAGKGRFFTQVSVVSDTQILIETYTGSTWTSDTKTVSSMGSSLHTLRISYASGTLTFYWDGTSIHTYSGTQNTGQTANQVYFGDNDAGSSSASESYWESVVASFGDQSVTAGIASETDTVPQTAAAETPSGLRRILTGETATANVRIYGATPGQAYRRYDVGSVVLESAVADSNGKVTFTGAGTGYIQGYTDNTYATPLTGQRWPSAGVATYALGNVFDTSPVARLGLDPVAIDGSYYYPTSQYGGRAQVCESDDYWFALYRTGGMGTDLGGTNGNVVVIRKSKATGVIDGPVTIRSGITEGHEIYCIARAPDGELRFIYGGQNAAVYMRISSAPDDISSWGAPVQILTAQFAFAGTFAIDSNGRNHIAAAAYSGGGLMYGTSTDAAPTSFTWTTLVNETGLTSSGWGVLFGDMDVHEESGTVTVGIVWSMYKKDGTFPTNYRYAYYAQTSDNGATWKKAGGSTITVPMSTNGTTGAVSAADEISSAYHYGAWCHLAFLTGAQPHVFVDNGTDVGETYCSIRYWSGSAWTKNSTNIPMWETGGVNADWGVLLTSDHDERLYLYASVGYSFDPTLDATYDGFRLIRQTSTDHFATQTTYLIADGDSYPPLSYAELADTGTDFNTDQTGICYPKVSTDPRTVLFAAVDKDYATLFLASISSVDVGLASETDTAFGVTPVQANPVGIATEDDTGLAITPDAGGAPQSVNVGVGDETDTGLAIAGATVDPQSVVVGLATETDSALAIAVPGTFTMNFAGVTPGTVVGAYLAHEWIGPQVPYRSTGSYPGPVVQEVAVGDYGEVAFQLPAGEYIAWMEDFPTRRRFFKVTEEDSA